MSDEKRDIAIISLVGMNNALSISNVKPRHKIPALVKMKLPLTSSQTAFAASLFGLVAATAAGVWFATNGIQTSKRFRGTDGDVPGGDMPDRPFRQVAFEEGGTEDSDRAPAFFVVSFVDWLFDFRWIVFCGPSPGTIAFSEMPLPVSCPEESHERRRPWDFRVPDRSNEWARVDFFADGAGHPSVYAVFGRSPVDDARGEENVCVLSPVGVRNEKRFSRLPWNNPRFRLFVGEPDGGEPETDASAWAADAFERQAETPPPAPFSDFLFWAAVGPDRFLLLSGSPENQRPAVLQMWTFPGWDAAGRLDREERPEREIILLGAGDGNGRIRIEGRNGIPEQVEVHEDGGPVRRYPVLSWNLFGRTFEQFSEMAGRFGGLEVEVGQ